ncbi:hypothetical protein [Streptomyces sp. NPDC088358]|uniref:hypothetical protein n=1 Tax=Streptomyces sp. NPDC088358 TaxID=3365857 RepID=UPI003819305E
MLIYEYLPIELARRSVVRKAARLGRAQVLENARIAREREERAAKARAEPHRLSELFIARLQCAQWDRIAHVMEQQEMSVYVPSRDRRAVRHEEERLRRLADGVGCAERAGIGVPEILRHQAYRIEARAAGSLPAGGDPVVILHLMAASSTKASDKAWAIHGKIGGLYQGGGYRITSVGQVLPEPGEFL